MNPGESGYSALLTFDRDHTIINLSDYAKCNQPVAVATHVPSIATPAATDSWIAALDWLRRGCYAWIMPESDLPELGVMSADKIASPPGASFPFATVGQHLKRIGYAPRYIEPMQHPLLFPPLVRYLFGEAAASDLYDLGGETNGGVPSAASDLFDFRVVIGFSGRETKQRENRQAYNLPLKTQINNTHAANATSVLLPRFIFAGREAITYASYGTAVLAPTSTLDSYCRGAAGNNIGGIALIIGKTGGTLTNPRDSIRWTGSIPGGGTGELHADFVFHFAAGGLYD